LILIAMKLDLDIHVGESHSIVGDAPQLLKETRPRR
jgi:hypothetical protein